MDSHGIQRRSVSGGTVGQYSYDGDGKRVKKVIPGTGETTIFVYDAGGKLVAEYSTNLSSPQQVQYLTNDHLGTPRIMTDLDGKPTARTDYMPYGEEIIALGGRSSTEKYVADTVRQGFTGYERDIDTGLDFAQARYYASALGRFTSVDPENAGASADNPQTWNAYAYVGNNPINITDPTGLSWYFNKESNQYRWFGDKDKVADGFVGVVGNTGERGSFSYEAADGTFVTLDPYSNNFQTNIATKADAMKLADRLYQFDEKKRAFAAGYNKNYDRNMNIVTAMAAASAIVIAGPVIGLSGAGTATLGLTQAAAPAGAAALQQLMTKAEFVKDLSGKTQFMLRGDARQIFDGIAQGARKIGPDRVKFSDGTVVQLCNSTKDGPLKGPTIQVVENGIKYVYRIRP